MEGELQHKLYFIPASGGTSQKYIIQDNLELFTIHFTSEMNADKPDNEVPIFSLHSQCHKTVLKALESSKTSGPDEIKPFFRIALKKLRAPLTYLFTDCLTHAMWPSSWKAGRSTPVHKEGRKLR